MFQIMIIIWKAAITLKTKLKKYMKKSRWRKNKKQMPVV